MIDFFDWLDDFEHKLKGDVCNENRTGEENRTGQESKTTKTKERQGEEMKKIACALLLCCVLGCSGINTGIVANTAIDVAFSAVLQNNIQFKPVVIASLGNMKLFLAGSVTYDMMLAEVGKQFAGPYAPIGAVITLYLSEEKPISTSIVPMFDSYKSGVIKKIDRFIALANVL